MDSRQAQSLLPELCSGCLDAEREAAVRAMIEECPDCQREWHLIQSTLLLVSTTSQPLLTPEQSQRMWQQCSEKLHARIEKERLAKQNPTLWSWIKLQPRWGWAALGGAVAVLGSVWLMAPDTPDTNTAPTYAAAGANSELVMFRRPSGAASGLVNHHAGMAFDPFTDHVGSNLVSYSATAPRQ